MPEPAIDWLAPEQLLRQTYRFYQRQLPRFQNAEAYLASRGIHDRALIERMGIGYAPGACLRGYLERLGYGRRALLESGLVDARGRDCFFRCLTFPLPEAGNLYGRSIANGYCRHRFLPGIKGGLYGWAKAAAFPRVAVVEGLFDAAALWQAGLENTVAALGSQLNNRQLAQLCHTGERTIYICFDADPNGSGPRAARPLSLQLRWMGVEALRVELPCGHDPTAFFMPAPMPPPSSAVWSTPGRDVSHRRRMDLPASSSPFRVVDEQGRELDWINRFLDMQQVRGLAPLSLRTYASMLLHFCAVVVAPAWHRRYPLHRRSVHRIDAH